MRNVVNSVHPKRADDKKMAKPLSHALLRFLSLLPRSLLQWLGTLVGRLHALANTRAARVTTANLNLCFPTLNAAETQRLVRASLVETGKTMLETPAVWLGKTARIDRWIVAVENEALLLEALAETPGLLILLPHLGNWELFNVYFRRHGRMTAVYQPPEEASLDALITELRSRHGNELVPANRRGLTRLYQSLKQGGRLVILPDQIPASGRFVPFFGNQALTDELSVRLLKKTHAKMLGAAVLRLPSGQFKLVFMPPDDAVYATDINKAMLAVNRLVEDLAQLALPQYQWEYKRFRKRPPGETRLYQFNMPPENHK